MDETQKARISAEVDRLHPWPDEENLLGDARDLEDTALERALKRSLRKDREPTTVREAVAAVEEPDINGHPFMLDPPASSSAPHPRSQLTDARTLPRTLDEAMQSLAIVEESYAESVNTYMTAFAAWMDADRVQARTRVQCVKDLMRPVGETPMSAGLSASAAKDRASDHPIYTNAKDHVAELALNKAEAEADRDLLLQSLKNARAILYALIARGGASPRAKPETLLDRQRTIAFMTPEERDELRAILDGHAEDDDIATGQVERGTPSRGDLAAHDTLDEARGHN